MKLNFNKQLRESQLWFCLAVLSFFILSAQLLAQAPYLTPGHPDGIALLAPPPPAGSAEEAADLASVRAVFQGRTAEELLRAKKDYSISLFLFAPAIGTNFQAGKFPLTEALYAKVKASIGPAIDAPKNYWKRKRPYVLDPKLALGDPEPSASYPSGHSARGTVYALLVAELFPDKKDAVLAIGRTIGWDRVLIGKHFPTDVQAGRVLGQAIYRELSKNAEFQHDLAEAKAEVATSMSKGNEGYRSH
jgi:acid phosphatase (class A)